MILKKGKSYFLSVTEVVLRANADKKSEALNHLIFGDWLRYLGKEQNDWISIHCRGHDGWILKGCISEERPLEINFIDVGQGDGCHIVTPEDKIIIIDSGVRDNMFRFIRWRYNLMNRKVANVDGVKESDENALEPFKIDNIVISHPDKDHYFGFRELFRCKKLQVQNVYHNGIVERPIVKSKIKNYLKYYSKDDLGGYYKYTDGKYYLWDIVTTNSQMHKLIELHRNTRKEYLTTLREAINNNPNVKFLCLSAKEKYLDGFDANDKLKFKILGPVTKKIASIHGSKNCLVRLGAESIMKNGHSIVFHVHYGKLKILLGGDLNTESENYLIKHYCKSTLELSKLEDKLRALQLKGNSLTDDEKEELEKSSKSLENLVKKGRRYFQSDIVKACHHGSHHFSETFLKILNSNVTVVSSGDKESYSHPRPDALGSFGKYGRGIRPLIFSTELARSTNEFVEIFKYYDQLKDYEDRIKRAESSSKKKELKNEMQTLRDRNVAVYGMITLRTDGEKVIIGQKLEKVTRLSKKWDIHELYYNNLTSEYEYLK